MWVADEESKVEALQDFLRYHRGIAWLCGCRVGVGSTVLLLSTTAAIYLIGGVAVGYGGFGSVHANGRLGFRVGGFGANAALDPVERGSNTGRFGVWRQEIVEDIFDEDSLALEFHIVNLSATPHGKMGKVGKYLILPPLALNPIEDSPIR